MSRDVRVLSYDLGGYFSFTRAMPIRLSGDFNIFSRFIMVGRSRSTSHRRSSAIALDGTFFGHK